MVKSMSLASVVYRCARALHVRDCDSRLTRSSANLCASALCGLAQVYWCEHASLLSRSIYQTVRFTCTHSCTWLWIPAKNMDNRSQNEIENRLNGCTRCCVRCHAKWSDNPLAAIATPKLHPTIHCSIECSFVFQSHANYIIISNSNNTFQYTSLSNMLHQHEY